MREASACMDMSFMAKFLVQGPDAERCSNRVCANDVSVPIGRIVYTQWLNERGGIMADLTVTRLAEEPTSSSAPTSSIAGCSPWIDRHVDGGELVTVTDVPPATTLLTVQGPRSRELLSRLTTADLSNDSFPYHDGARDRGRLRRALALRVTYLGELGLGAAHPDRLALTVFDALFAAGADLGFRNVGARRDGQPATGEGLPGLRARHRQLRFPIDVGLGSPSPGTSRTGSSAATRW